MAILASAGAALFSALSYINSLTSEPWSRYFIIVGGFFIDDQLGAFIGLAPVNALLSFVISNVFNWPDFSFPVYYGVNTLLVLVILSPLLFFLIRDLFFGR